MVAKLEWYCRCCETCVKLRKNELEMKKEEGKNRGRGSVKYLIIVDIEGKLFIFGSIWRSNFKLMKMAQFSSVGLVKHRFSWPGLVGEGEFEKRTMRSDETAHHG